jgi:hypothetical protein
VAAAGRGDQKSNDSFNGKKKENEKDNSSILTTMTKMQCLHGSCLSSKYCGSNSIPNQSYQQESGSSRLSEVRPRRENAEEKTAVKNDKFPLLAATTADEAKQSLLLQNEQAADSVMIDAAADRIADTIDSATNDGSNHHPRCSSLTSSADDDEARFALPSTLNNSPLTAKIRTWDEKLRVAHQCFCSEKSTCCGSRPLHEVLQDPDGWLKADDSKHRCLQAIEVELLLHSLYFGLRLRDRSLRDEDIPSFEVDNYPCSDETRESLTATLKKEIEAGYIDFISDKPRWLSPIHGKDESTATKQKIRLLRDFSVPEGRGINDFANNRPFKMMQHEDAYALLQPSAFMAKVDIANAFRTVGLHHADRELTCFKWEFDGVMRYCIDRRATMGHASSPSFFCRLSQAVRAIMAAEGHTASVVFVDDFFIIDVEQDVCLRAREQLTLLLDSLGFTEKEEKREGPIQDIVFLGLRYETNTDDAGGMRVTVPEEKLRKAEATAKSLSSRAHISLKELQSAVGYFNHLAQAIFAARAFLRRLIHKMKNAEATGQRTIKMTRDMQLDFHFWERLAREWNGTAVVLVDPVMSAGFFATDASDVGMGGFFERLTYSVGWDGLRAASKNLPKTAQKFNKDKLWPDKQQAALWMIHYRELFGIWWALLLWTEPCQLGGKTVTIHCDNAVARCDLNNASAPNVLMMRLVRHILQFCVAHNIRLNVVAISSAANVLADTLSRLDTHGYTKALAEWEEEQKLEDGSSRPTYTRRVFRNPGLLEHEAEAVTAVVVV